MSNPKQPIYPFKAFSTKPDELPKVPPRRGMFPDAKAPSGIIGDTRPDERPHLDILHPAFKGLYKDQEFGDVTYEIMRKVELKEVSGFVYSVNVGIDGVAPIIFFFNGVAEDGKGRMAVDLRRLSNVPEEAGIAGKVDDMLQRLVLTLLPMVFNYYQEIKAARAAETESAIPKV